MWHFKLFGISPLSHPTTPHPTPPHPTTPHHTPPHPTTPLASVACLHSYKELHHEGDYAKGKGKEFEAWRSENFPNEYYLPLERAAGSRQDLSFDGAVPIYANRKIVSKFLHKLVLVPNHSNILEDFLWHTLGSVEMVALLRVHTLYDLVLSRPLRWLSGKSHELRDWSIYSMAGALDLVETARPAPTSPSPPLLHSPRTVPLIAEVG